MPVLAIEINPDHMILVAAKSANRQFQITDALEVAIESEATPEQIGEKLKEVVAANNWSRHEAVVVISRSKSELREMTVPPAPDDELPSMVKFKARADFASLNENWLLDYVPLSSDSNAPRKVLASAIAPQVEQEVRSIVETAGLKLKQLVLRPYATLDLLKSRFGDGDCRLIIDPNCSSIDMTLVEGEKLVATRTVRIPASHDENARANQLISEVRRTLASAKRSLGGKKITEVVLCDDPAKNKHLAGDLTKRLELPVQFVNPFSESPYANESMSTGRSYLFCSAIGSLTQVASGERPEIDFVNPRKAAEKTVNRDRYYLYGGLAALAALLCIVVGWWWLSSQSSKIEKLTEQWASAKKVNDGVGNAPPVDDTIAAVGEMDKWKSLDVNWLEQLDVMSQRYLTADQIIVSGFDADADRRGESSIAIKGKVVSTDQEEELIKSLRKTEMVEGTEFQRFIVNTGPSGVSENDNDYPMTFDHAVTLGDDEQTMWRLNQDAREFLQSQNEQGPVGIGDQPTSSN